MIIGNLTETSQEPFETESKSIDLNYTHIHKTIDSFYKTTYINAGNSETISNQYGQKNIVLLVQFCFCLCKYQHTIFISFFPPFLFHSFL